jgi:hypothetical protein
LFSLQRADVPPENVTQSQGMSPLKSVITDAIPRTPSFSTAAHKDHGSLLCVCAMLVSATADNSPLLESVSWIVVADGLPDAPPGGFRLKLLHDLADAWAKERASMRMVLATLTNDPAEQLRYRPLSIAQRVHFSVVLMGARAYYGHIVVILGRLFPLMFMISPRFITGRWQIQDFSRTDIL